MKKITSAEIRRLLKKYPRNMNPIKVVDFKSACNRSEQMLVENYRKVKSLKQMIYRSTSIKANNYQYSYNKKIYHLTNESRKKFCSIIANKYGSVKNYWSLRR